MITNMFENSLRVSDTLRVLVLCAVISVQKFFPTEISSPLIVLFGLSIMPFGKIQCSYLKLVWPLIVVLIVGFLGVTDHEPRHILRDISFALTPIALIFIGYWIAKNNGMWPLILKIMGIFGFVLALKHLSGFIQNPDLLNSAIDDVRKSVGAGYDLVILIFVLGIFQKHFGIYYLFPRFLPPFIVMPVMLASFVLSFSRTEFMVGIILSLSLLGWISQVNYRMVLTVVVVMVGYIVIAVVTPENETGTFRSKLVRSIEEITVSDYRDMEDINYNWRGYEAYRGVATFLSGTIQQQILGQGFGALVDLGFYIKLADREYRYIPVTHNGYAYILVKAGLLGLICYTLFYISVIRYAVRYCSSMNNEERYLARLLLGCILSLIFTMFVVGGMAEMHNVELVLLVGYLMRRIGYLQAEKSRINIQRIVYE